MKYVWLILFSAITACSTQPKFAADDLANVLSADDSERILQIYRTQRAIGDDVWPGFANAPVRMVLVDKNMQWAFNIQPQPEFYTSIPVPALLKQYVQSAAFTEPYRNEVGVKLPSPPSLLYNVYSAAQTENHFQQSVYFVKTLSEFHAVGDKMTSDEWVYISLREIFHTFQDQYVNYTPDFIQDITYLHKYELRGDKELIKLLAPEFVLLSKAACETQLQKTKELLRQALALRALRWKYMQNKYGKSPDAWERYESWAEGTATYVERQIIARQSSASADNKMTWCQTIQENKKKTYWSMLGFAYALILDQLKPDWKSLPPNQKLFFDGYFQSL